MMRYDNGRMMLIASADELAGAAASLGLQRGSLSTTLFEIGGAEQIRAFEDGLAPLDETQRNVFETALPIACDPVRSAILHISQDGIVARRFLAWSPAGTIASIEQLDGDLGLRTLDAGQIRADILASLGADASFGGSDVRLPMEARDLIALVAMADAYRREWLNSLLTHNPSRMTLAASDVAEAIAASSTDDPRWISSVLDKVVPADLREAMDTATTDLALQRLTRAGVLSVIDGDSTAPPLYSPTADAAEVLAGIAGAARIVAFTIYGMTSDGPGYETTLFARGTTTVWTMMISPRESFVASASPTALVTLIDAALGEC